MENILNDMPERYPFTSWRTFGNHLYRRPDEKTDVVFVNKTTGVRKIIVDENGMIVDFPGIVKEKEWMRVLENENRLKPEIRFETIFKKYDEERYIMIWEVQPDGMYWMDGDGFGNTSDCEIRLYAFIDQKGDFMGPFRVYNVGDKEYLEE